MGLHKLYNIPIFLWCLKYSQRRSILDSLAVTTLAFVGLLGNRKLLQSGFPPGVDTPTFLHMSWFTRETLRGVGGLVDPYWYGGFPIFFSYPPLSYLLVGSLATLPGISLVVAYKFVLVTAYIAIGVSTYMLAVQLGNSRVWSTVAGILTLLAYPMLTAVGQWGWFSTVVALPLAILSLMMLERAFQAGAVRFAILGGVLLGASVLTHHMTFFAFTMWIPAWVLFHYFTQHSLRSRLIKVTFAFVICTAATSLWWIVPWLGNAIDVGFQREVAGSWSFPLEHYLKAIVRRDFIGVYTYPTYLGFGLAIMAVGATLQFLISPNRFTPYAIFLIMLVAFSVGEQSNPVIRLRPIDGIDVARFQMYLVPVITIIGVAFLAKISDLLGSLIQTRYAAAKWLATTISGVLVVLILAQAVRDSEFASQRLFEPYQVSSSVKSALEWFAQDSNQGKAFGVGFLNWDDFLLPYYLKQPVVDGWHDEGASNWRTLRPLRVMMWTRNVDAPKIHSLLGKLDGRYVIVHDYFLGESPRAFRAALRNHTDLFSEVADWGDLTIFERIHP